MTIEERIVSLLKASTNLTDMVKARIRPLALTQLDKRPALAYQVVSTETFDTFSGQADWRRVTLQVDSFADTYGEAKEVSRLVKAAINGQSGTAEGIEVGFVKHKEDSDLTEPPDVGQERVIHRLQSNYLILYREL